MDEQEGGALVRRAVEEIWNRGRLDVADALFAPGYVNHGGLIPDLVRGPEALKLSAALYRRAFPDLHVSVRSLRVDGDAVVLRWVALVAAPPDRRSHGPAGRLTGATRVRLVEGRIVETWTAWDQPSALRRLGIGEATGVAP